MENIINMLPPTVILLLLLLLLQTTDTYSNSTLVMRAGAPLPRWLWQWI